VLEEKHPLVLSCGERKERCKIVRTGNNSYMRAVVNEHKEITNGARALWWPLKKKSKMALKCFKKFKTKNLGVDNVEIYKAM
jgi:hypothetical protein